MTKIKVNLGDEYKNATIKLPARVPVTRDFNNQNVIGHAQVRIEPNGEMTAEMDVDIVPEELLNLGCSGQIVKQEGNVIHEFQLHSVSFLSPRL